MKPFNHVESHRPGRSVFNLSHFKIFDCDLGQLIPVLCTKMLPGDKFRIANEIIIRGNPFVAPIMHEINVFVHYFFVALRLLWPKPVIGSALPENGSWEEFMTGGKDGILEPTKPKWNFGPRGVNTLWDYFGFPINVDPVGAYPDVWPLRAYNFVYNEYYRDQNYMDEVDFDDTALKVRCWEKDYFTSALPWQQRGLAPALPISGTSSAIFNGALPYNLPAVNVQGTGSAVLMHQSGGENAYFSISGGSGSTAKVNASLPAGFRNWLNDNVVDLNNLATFDVNDLRLAFQTQKFLERNARAGSRYNEFLRAHYSVAPRDERLQRPEYIGGTRSPVIVSEVLQTSESTQGSPQGNLAGHSISAGRNGVGSYFAQEPGVIIGIMSIMPRPVYQQGIDREWLGETRYDEYLPEFVNLSEQPVYNAELYATSSETENRDVFGFQGRYDEYRSKRNMICGVMRSQAPQSLDFWHIARSFASRPALNEEFLKCVPRRNYLAVPSRPGWIVTFGNVIRAVRPLPIVGTPGLIDHH